MDKTGLISLINGSIGTRNNLTCISRPRRFGKSYAAQIKEKNYPKVLENYGGEILLVGINYDAESKEHTCVIERR